MNQARRPRVAAIGIDDASVESILPLCGDLRRADSVADYLQGYDWTETDIVVAEYLRYLEVDPRVNIIIAGRADFYWTDTFMDVRGVSRNRATTDVTNTERELSVRHTCPEIYRTLAAQLCEHLMSNVDPPTVVTSSRADSESIVETTSGKTVATRIELPLRELDGVATIDRPLVLILPQVTNLTEWFAAFLTDVNENDHERVPQPPPRLIRPMDWYTPEERSLAGHIERVSVDIDRLVEEREVLKSELAEAGRRGDEGVRRAIWADGHDLVAAVSDLLTGIGFAVQDMDVGLAPNEQKHEGLRLSFQNRPGWEAIVEVKGYANGTRTNDARQIREHREHYFAENGSLPDLTLWVANPFRQRDPSSRPKPGGNGGEAAENVGAVHLLATDLYRVWGLVQTGVLQVDDAAEDLINAPPGLWCPSALGS